MMPRLPLSGPLGLSLAALLIAVVVVLATVPSLLVAAFGFGTGGSEPGERIAALTALHEKKVKESLDRFNGRSAFFRPPPLYVAPPPTPPKAEDEPPPPPPPPPGPPANYTGPSLKAIFGDQAWFMAPNTNEKTLYLAVGQEDPNSGVKLLSTNPPWSVKVAHKGGEYDVELFKNVFEPYFSGAKTTSRPPLPGLFFQPPAIASPAAPAPPPPAAADRVTGRNVARPAPPGAPATVEGTIEPNAKVQAGEVEDEDEEVAEVETTEDEAEEGEQPESEEEVDPASEEEPTNPETPDEGEEEPETMASFSPQRELLLSHTPFGVRVC
jgi:hypothetical protein